MIGGWTAKQFGFADASRGAHNNPETENPSKKNYTSLQDTLTQYGITDVIASQSIPDGFQPEKHGFKNMQEREVLRLFSPILRI